MKNIHLIPTEKPSRLGLHRDNKLNLHDNLVALNPPHFSPQNIYITSDEQPKNNDYYITDGKKIYYCNTLNPTRNNHYKKIILTTDQDLIADGVEVIDDEFLEWFVKNPSCEFVEVYEVEGKLFAEPTILQEEPNPFELPKALPDNVFYDSLEPKQETLEEVAERIYQKGLQDDIDLSFYDGVNIDLSFYDGVRLGAKWQAEIMYSEEEVCDILFKLTEYFWGHTERMSLREWFEQFKKK
jgi:hypothetical protein